MRATLRSTLRNEVRLVTLGLNEAARSVQNEFVGGQFAGLGFLRTGDNEFIETVDGETILVEI